MYTRSLSGRSKLWLAALGTAAAVLLSAGCGEKNPSGPTTYTLTLASSPAGSGSFFQLPEGTPLQSTTSFTSGEKITVKVSPKSPKYKFLGWDDASSDKDTVVTIVMDGNKTLTAKFEERYSITTNVSPAGSGTISRIPDAPWYSADSLVALKATANPGYKFNGWEGDTVFSADKISFGYVVTRDVTFVANFKKMPVVTAKFTVDGVETPGAGSLSIEPNKPYYENGDVVTVTITNAAGYMFSEWLNGGAGGCTGSENPCTITITDTDVSLTADFWSL